VITTSATPAANAASTTAKISSRPRCPVASTIPCDATTRSTSKSAGTTAPEPSTTGTFGSGNPAAASSSWIRTHIGTEGPVCRPVSFSASTVGSHTIRAPGTARVTTRARLRRRRVVRLQAEPGQAERGEPRRQGHVVHDPAHDVGVDVDVEVIRTTHQLPGAVGGGFSDSRQDCRQCTTLPSEIPLNI
jgi:hypothetical protein